MRNVELDWFGLVVIVVVYWDCWVCKCFVVRVLGRVGMNKKGEVG